MASEIEKEMNGMLKNMAQAKADWQKNLNHLGQTVDTKADKTWLSELEASIQAELDKLNGRGTGVTKKELDRYLAELRAQLDAMQGGAAESGSAAFRCIACDRTLPEAASWRMPKQQPIGRPAAVTAGLEPSMVSNRHHQSRNRTAATAQSERIYKAGFPMVNPKIRPSDRRLDHSRTFGKNMRPSILDRPSRGNSRPVSTNGISASSSLPNFSSWP